MEAEETRKYTNPHSMYGKLDNDMDFPAQVNRRIVQCSQSPEMDKGLDRDCSQSYTVGTISDNLAKLGVDNLRLKNVSKFEMPVPVLDMNGPFGDDIDRKQAAKRVVPPVVTKEENTVPPEGLLGVQHKKRPLKRAMKEASDHEEALYTLDPVKLRQTAQLIQDIKTNKIGGENICLSYHPAKFSHITNLKVEPYAKIPSGTYGDIKKVKDSVTGQIFIQKVVKKNAKGVISVESNEYAVPLQFPDVENIAKFYGLAWDSGQLSFFMEDAGISLRQLINSPYSSMLYIPGIIENIVLDVMTAISHMAKHGITHCDIKPENVCYDVAARRAKLVDFGSSKTLQDEMTYGGITPEYLDPAVNKYLYEANIVKNKDYPKHRLDEKDDVYSAGMVALFLFMKCHPTIQFYTGFKDYPIAEAADTMKMRISVIKQISEMNHESLMKLLNIPTPDVMKELLFSVLELDRKDRWTAKQAVAFLEEKLNTNVQPPSKLPRQEQQPHYSKLENASKLANLYEKGMDHDFGQKLGIAFKDKAPFAQPGGVILLPVKLKGSQHFDQLKSGFSYGVQFRGPPSQQETECPKLMEVGNRRCVPEMPQVTRQEETETKEYADLVESFNLKLAPSQKSLPVKVNQPQNFSPHSLQASPLQARMLPPNTGAGMYFGQRPAHNHQQRVVSGPFQAFSGSNFNQGPVQNHQQGLASGAFQGLFGSNFNRHGDLCDDPTFETSGNIPDIYALMQQPSDERARPKLKGVRRSSSNQD
jgi:serine/threonine protein kinase